MLGRTALAVTAIGGLGIGVVAAGPSALASGATQKKPAAIGITHASPAAAITPTFRILSRDPHARLAPGDLFLGPKYDLGTPPAGSKIGPEIVDDHGRAVWFLNSKAGDRATDVRVQTYRGKRVLTYWLGHTALNPGVGDGNDHILGTNYKTLRIVHGHGTEPGSGQKIQADQHEFLLTPGGTALITCYAVTTINANKYRPKGDTSNRSKQKVYDSIAEEINLATGKMVFEWRSLAHVSPARSHVPLPVNAKGKPAPNIPWDYFHINAIKIDSDFNLIISGRHTWSIYKVNRHNGAMIWILRSGNHATDKNSTFKIGKGAAFAWQHDPEPLGNNTYRIFDNNWNQTNSPSHPAHVLTVKLDFTHKTAINMGHINYPGKGILAGSQGNSERLAGAHILIGWGAGGHITEVNAKHQQVYDAEFPGFNTYRAYKNRWVGRPANGPALKFTSPGGKRQVDVVWNGANTVARWRILGGSRAAKLTTIGSIAWDGLDTAFRLSRYPTYLKVVGLDSRGRVVGSSAAKHT